MHTLKTQMSLVFSTSISIHYKHVLISGKTTSICCNGCCSGMNMFNCFHQGLKVNLALLDFLVYQVVQEKVDHQVQRDQLDCQDPLALRVHRDRKENLVTV